MTSAGRTFAPVPDANGNRTITASPRLTLMAAICEGRNPRMRPAPDRSRLSPARHPGRRKYREYRTRHPKGFLRARKLRQRLGNTHSGCRDRLSRSAGWRLLAVVLRKGVLA